MRFSRGCPFHTTPITWLGLFDDTVFAVLERTVADVLLDARIWGLLAMERTRL